MSRYDDLLAFRFPRFDQSYTERDTMLYALGVGGGSDPLDLDELRFVYEKNLFVLPSLAVTLAYPGFWYRDLDPGLDFVRTLHASERIELDGPLPAAARVTALPEIVAVHDKGEGRGSLVVSRREIVDAETGKRLATVQQTAFCRGDGGLGGAMVPAPAPEPLPQREPDLVLMVPTLPQSALIYRLSGDYNPLHAEPDFAKAAGLERPILHGLSTHGNICRVLVKRHGFGGGFLRMMDCRFTGIVYPGDTLRIEIWQDGATMHFRALVDGRKVVDNGIAEFAAA
jgi:acyl dehydratase